MIASTDFKFFCKAVPFLKVSSERNDLGQLPVKNTPLCVIQGGCLMRYPQTMKLFKFSLLIPPSTSGVERGFSAMNLIVSPLRTNLNQLSINRFMQIAINGPESFNERDMEKLVDNY